MYFSRKADIFSRRKVNHCLIYLVAFIQRIFSSQNSSTSVRQFIQVRLKSNGTVPRLPIRCLYLWVYNQFRLICQECFSPIFQFTGVIQPKLFRKKATDLPQNLLVFSLLSISYSQNVITGYINGTCEGLITTAITIIRSY